MPTTSPSMAMIAMMVCRGTLDLRCCKILHPVREACFVRPNMLRQSLREVLETGQNRYVYTYTYIYICMYVCTYAHVYRACVYIYIYTRTVYMCVLFLYVCLYSVINMWCIDSISISLYVCMYVCVWCVSVTYYSMCIVCLMYVYVNIKVCIYVVDLQIRYGYACMYVCM